VHKVSADLWETLTSDPNALAACEGLPALARNEWICRAIDFLKAPNGLRYPLGGEGGFTIETEKDHSQEKSSKNAPRTPRRVHALLSVFF
jgi:hypothetical protein